LRAAGNGACDPVDVADLAVLTTYVAAGDPTADADRLRLLAIHGRIRPPLSSATAALCWRLLAGAGFADPRVEVGVIMWAGIRWAHQPEDTRRVAPIMAWVQEAGCDPRQTGSSRAQFAVEAAKYAGPALLAAPLPAADLATTLPLFRRAELLARTSDDRLARSYRPWITRVLWDMLGAASATDELVACLVEGAVDASPEIRREAAVRLGRLHRDHGDAASASAAWLSIAAEPQPSDLSLLAFTDLFALARSTRDHALEQRVRTLATAGMRSVAGADLAGIRSQLSDLLRRTDHTP
jgi:hypothetical protein